MILAYVGIPGSGKSYDAIRKIIENLKRQRKIYTNINGVDHEKQRMHIAVKTGLEKAVVDELLVYVPDKEILQLVPKTEPKSLIVIDEVHKLISNRAWDSEDNKIFAEWASTHRHTGHDVVLITQDIEKIDKHVRTLVDWTFHYRKMNHFGKLVQQKYRKCSYDSHNHYGRPVKTEFLTYDKSIFPCYSSYVSDDIEEMGVQKPINVLRHPIVYLTIISIMLSGYFISQSSFIKGELFPGAAEAQEIAEELKTGKSIEDESKKSDSMARIAEPPRAQPPIKAPEKKKDIPREFICKIGEMPSSRIPSAYDLDGRSILYSMSDGSTFVSNTGSKPDTKENVNINGFCVL